MYELKADLECWAKAWVSLAFSLGEDLLSFRPNVRIKQFGNFQWLVYALDEDRRQEVQWIQVQEIEDTGFNLPGEVRLGKGLLRLEGKIYSFTVNELRAGCK